MGRKVLIIRGLPHLVFRLPAEEMGVLLGRGFRPHFQVGFLLPPLF